MTMWVESGGLWEAGYQGMGCDLLCEIVILWV